MRYVQGCVFSAGTMPKKAMCATGTEGFIGSWWSHSPQGKEAFIRVKDSSRLYFQ